MKKNLLTKYFSYCSIIILALTTGIAQAEVEATAPTTPSADQASAAPADDSQCPCNFKEASIRTDFKRITKGSIDCVLTNAVLFFPGKSGPTKQLNSVVLTSLGTPPDVSNLVMNVWGVTLVPEQENNPNSNLVNVCGKNLNGSKEKTIIKNDTQLKACISDIERAANALGVRCEDKS